MAYSGKRNYKTMREKNMLMKRRVKVALIIFSLAAVIWTIKNWIYVEEYFMSFF